MPLPRPEIGLIVHYGFVWSGPDHGPPPDAGKDRPCLIVDLLPEEILGRKTLRVTYLPISHAEPRKGESAILIKPKIANYLGLTAEKSYLYTSYACEDDWPFDVVPVPGSKGKFHYGIIPPAFFNVVTETFKQYLAQRPDFIYKC